MSVFKHVNQILNTYFTLYNFVFLIPVVEINLGMLFCGSRSFLTTLRSQNCSIPVYITIFASLGALLGFFTSITTTYFFRNYQFEETNKFKRKFSILMVLMQLLKCSLSLVYYLDSNFTDSLKFVISLVYSLFNLLDIYLNIPYRELQILKFYTICSSYYFAINLICNIWIFGSNLIQGYELFYYIILFGILSQGAFQILIQYRYNSIVKCNFYANSIHFYEKQIQLIDIYLEQMMALAKECSHSENSKCQLIELLQIHFSNCNYDHCLCQKESKSYLIKKQRIDLNYMKDLINCIFIWILEKQEIKNNLDDLEHLTLKYISFLYQFYGNSPRAYFQIKQYLSKNVKQSSNYFKMISQVLCKAIENQLDNRLEQQSKQNQEKSQNFLQRNQELTVYTVIQIDQVCAKFTPLITNCIQKKITFWQDMLKGYNSMDNFQVKSLGLAEYIQRLNRQFHFKLRQIDSFVQQYDSYQLKKLKMLFYLIVLNDTIKAQKLDEEGDDIKNRDMLKSLEIIHSSNFINGNIQTIIISLSQNIGKIVSKKDQKFMEFFGYDKEEAGSVQKVNDLMPLYISKLHDKFLMHYISRGSSQLIQNNFFSFIQTKDGFIQQAKVYIDYLFTNADDFQMAGNILKINSAYDFMIFNRKGLVVGVTQNLISKLFSEVKKIPKPSQILYKYYAFIFFKDILKIFKQKRDEIKKILSQAEMNAQIEKTSKGWFNLSESYEQVMTQFNHYIEYCQRNSKDIKNQVDISKMDLLSEQTIDFLDQFQAFKLLRKNITSSQNISSQDLKSRFGYSKDSKSLKLYQTRLFFKFSLHLSQFDLNKSDGVLNNDAYFILKFHDLTINKKPIGKKMEFTKSMITYLGATTSIGLLSQFGSQLSRLQTFNQNSLKDFQSIKLTMNSSSCSSKFKDIPIKMINSLVRMKTKSQDVLNQNEIDHKPHEKQNNSISIFSNKMLENLKSKRIQSKKNIDTPKSEQKDILNESQRDNNQKAMHSQEVISQDQDETVSDELEQENEEIVEVTSSEEEDEDKEVKLKSLLGQINIHEEFHKSQAKSQNHQILNKFKMSENYIKSLDPNYHIKKVLQHNSNLSQFSIALENAILEAQMELMQEQRMLETVKSIIEVKESSSDPIALNKYVSNEGIDSNQILDQFDSHRLFQQQSNQSKKSNFEYASKDSIIQNASGKDSPSLFKRVSAELSPIPIQKENQIQNKKSQFIYNQEASNDATLNSFINNNQQENSFSIADHTQKPVFQNPNELAYTFNDYTQRVNTPSLESNGDIVEEQQENVSKNIIKNKFQSNPKRKQQQNNDDQIYDESGSNDDYNMDFKFQKSIEQQEDIDGQLEQIKNQKKKRQKDKISFRQQLSFKSTKKSRNSNQDKKNVQINLLLQKGLKKDENVKEMFEGSVKSNSSSTRTRYGGIFLREILSSKRLPVTAQYYKAILFFFFLSFLTLNIVSLDIISSAMSSFSAYITIIRVPRQFQRQYSVALMGKYAQNQINLGYLSDNSNNTLLKMSQKFISRSYTAYSQQYINNSQIVSESWEQIKDENFLQEKYIFFKDHQGEEQNLVLNMIYENVLTQMMFLQSNQTLMQQTDSFLFLRKNYLIFQKDVILQVQDLINRISNTVDSLSNQFTIISIIAIISILSVGVLFFPLIYYINQYQEQILMIISKINKDQAEIEINKLTIINQLINTDLWDWLKYNYNGIFWMRYDQFDLNSTAHRNQKASSRIDINNNSNKRSLNLQSLIFVQKLSIFKRVWVQLILITAAVIYFAFIIVYINTQNPILKFPVLKNFNTFKTHLSINSIKICGSILAFDRYMAQHIKYYDISDINDFKLCLQNNINQLSDYMNINQNLVYDNSNPLPSAQRQIIKDLYEGNICNIVTSFPCLPNDLTNNLGLSQIYIQLTKCVITFPQIFNYSPQDPLSDDQIKNYLNDDCYKLYFFLGFNRQDEVPHLFSSNVNASISIISNDIQTFLTQYLNILGILLAIFIAIVLLINWFYLRKRLLLMNLLLTLIPEEKLSEEIILNMLKRLRYE
ncbi:hypothetical protein ABPG74_022790 [Tetrahymena malaccensis]